MTEAQARAALSGGAQLIVDGHGIYSVDAFVEAGWPLDVVAPFDREHHSTGDNPKHWINHDPEGSCRGVYALEFLEAIYRALKCTTDGHVKVGRGSRARQMASIIEEVTLS